MPEDTHTVRVPHAPLPTDPAEATPPSRRATASMPRRATLLARQRLHADAVAIVERDHARDLTLADVARELAVSPRHLQRILAETGETTFRTLLARVRLREAARMLETSIAPVRVIAARVGYRQPTQFAKAFRRQHGVTPSAYRAMAILRRDDQPLRLAAPPPAVGASLSADGGS